MELTFDRLTKEYGAKIAVDRVSAALGPGVHGLLGANGAGKTTLMRMACGVLRPTSGEVRFDATPIERMGGDYRALLGYLPQDFGYYPEFTALDFMEYMAALKGIARRAARERSLELLSAVGLAGEERRRIRTFSGGMKQRLGIALALVGHPRLLILDEPTSGLDPVSRDELTELLGRIAADGQRSVLFSTHITSDLEKCASHISFIKDGQIQYTGTLEDFRAHYAYLRRGDAPLTLEDIIVSVERRPLDENAII